MKQKKSHCANFKHHPNVLLDYYFFIAAGFRDRSVTA